MQFSRSLRQISFSLLLRLLPAIILSACSTLPDVEAKKAAVIVSVPDQRLAILRPGRSPKVYRISTGFRGIGDRLGSYATPTDTHVVAQ